MAEGYTIASTIILGLVVVFGTYVMYLLFKKFKIKLDKYFVYGLFPWILLSVFVRVYEDAGLYPTTFFTQSPGILILFVGLIIPFIILSKFIEKKYGILSWKTLASIGALFVGFHLPFLRFVEVKGFFMVFIFFCISIGIIGIFRKMIRFDLLTFWALAAHMVDASATFVSITFFNYTEQHVLPTLLISNLGGAWVMYPLKILVLVPVLYIINKYSKEDKTLRNTLLIAIITLGLAAGLRDAVRLLMGV